MFDVLLAEALKPGDEGGFVVSDQRLHSTALGPDGQPTEGGQQMMGLQMQPLTLSQATRKEFISSLQVVAASRSSVSVALSPTLSLSISLDKQCLPASSGEWRDFNNCSNSFQQCLRQCIVSLDALRLSRFENSRRVTISSNSAAADAFRNRFSSLRRADNNDRISAVPLLQHAQREMQRQIWKLRLQEMLKIDDLQDVHCSWVKGVCGFGGSVSEEVAVLEMQAAGDLNGIKESAAGNNVPQTLVLHVHPTFVEVESICGTDTSAPLLRFNTDALLKRHVQKWVKLNRQS